MKQLLLGLAFTAFATINTNAQDSKFDKNYPICYTNNGYKTCSAAAMEQSQRIYTSNPLPNESIVFTAAEPEPAHLSKYTRNRIKVLYDDGNAAYKGEETPTNDGVKTNIQRNKNYLDQSVTLPANDAGLSNR